MKVLLIDNLVMPDEGTIAMMDVHPHLGLLALAAVGEKAGHSVEIYDPKRMVRDGDLPYDERLYDHAARAFLATEPDVVGFTALGCSFLFVVNVAARLKQVRPDLPILLGGPHATMLDKQILSDFDQFDVIVRHEADETFPSVLEHLADLDFESVPGISWRARNGSLQFTHGSPKIDDLDSLPLGNYDLYPVEDLGLDLLRIEAGRGCPFACTFCSTAGFFQRSFRLKSAERLVAELDRLNARYGARNFKLDHDMFTANRKKVAEFCEAVKGRGYHWRASARVDCVDEELLELMAEAGCVNLYFGIETGSQRMQKISQKKLALSLVAPILASAERLGIETTASFITGYPEETAQDLADTLDLLGECASGQDCLPQLHLLAPEPGTPLFSQYGTEIKYDGVAGPYHSGVLTEHDETLILSHPDIFQTYYHFPTVLDRKHQIFAVNSVDLLRRLGPQLFDYSLRFFDGRLSQLIATFERFVSDGAEISAPVEPSALIGFLERHLGFAHHLVSLVRYALHVVGAETDDRESTRLPFDPEAPYELKKGAIVLEGMHDCDDLFSRICDLEGKAVLPDSGVPGKYGYVVVQKDGAAEVHRMEPSALLIARLFESPVKPSSLIAQLGSGGGKAFDLLASLAETGIIERAANMTKTSDRELVTN